MLALIEINQFINEYTRENKANTCSPRVPEYGVF